MDKIETDVDKGLQESGIEGFIRFSIKADNTEDNLMTHDGFKSFAEHEFDNNYTQAIKGLLKYWQGDAKTEMLWEAIKSLKEEILELRKEQHSEKKEEESGEVAF